MAKNFPSDTIPLIRRLWREWVRPHRSSIILVLALIAVAAIANALYPLMVKTAFDLLEKKDFASLAWAPVAVILATSTKGFATWGQAILTNRFVTRVEADMQSALYAHLIDADLARIARESPASLTQRFTTDFAFIKEALTLMAAQPVRTLGNLNAIVQEALAALSRYFAVLDEKPAVQERPDAKPLAVTAGEVVFDGVTFAYGDGKPALSGATFTAVGGRTTALVGRSGSGKSTLLSLVPRLMDVGSGAVRIDGQDVRDITLTSLRDRIAVVSQDIVLYDDTIRANICFGRKDATDAEVEAAARAAAAHDFIAALPDGYQSRVGDRGGRLSGGERQRVALARAFLKDAPILLLDEATSALDAESEALVQQALSKLMAGRTTMVIAHRLSTIRDADRIVVMNDGRVAEEGTHGELLALGGVYAGLHRRQFEE